MATGGRMVPDLYSQIKWIYGVYGIEAIMQPRLPFHIARTQLPIDAIKTE